MLSVRLDKKMEEELNILSSKKKTSYEHGSDLFGRYSSGDGDGDRSTTYKQKIKAMIDAKFYSSRA